MTDTSALPVLSTLKFKTAGASSATTPPWRAILLAAIVVAAAGGFVAASADQVAAARQEAGGELTMLLQFMAAVKAVMALAAVSITAWRLGHRVSVPLALSYVLSAALMSAAPTLIWQMADVTLGAILFHVGMLVLLGTAWADRGEVASFAATAIRRLRRI